MDFLRKVLRWHLTNCGPDNSAPHFISQVNWHHLLWLARQQGVLPFLQETLKHSVFYGSYPLDIDRQLTAVREVNELRSLAHAREICQVQRLFDREGVRAIGTNGWVAAHVCGNQPGLLPPAHMLQYLVLDEDFPRASAFLTEAGHPLTSDPEKLITSGQSPVQLSSDLGKSTAMKPVWDMAVEFSLGGIAHLRPAFHHWLILRAVRLRRSKMSLADAYEIVFLSRQITVAEWPSVLAEAEQFKLERTLSAIVSSAHMAVGLPPPVGPNTDYEVDRQGAGHNDISTGTSIRAPFLPTHPLVVEHMLRLANTNADDLVCDLGCGDGRIVICAATEFGARGVGIDCNPTRIREATACAAARGVSNKVSFQCGDLFAAKVANATVITCYLLPRLLLSIEKKLRLEARPGTRVVSHEFTFGHRCPEKTEIIRTGPMKVSQIYLWTI